MVSVKLWASRVLLNEKTLIIRIITRPPAMASSFSPKRLSNVHFLYFIRITVWQDSIFYVLLTDPSLVVIKRSRGCLLNLFVDKIAVAQTKRTSCCPRFQFGKQSKEEFAVKLKNIFCSITMAWDKIHTQWLYPWTFFPQISDTLSNKTFNSKILIRWGILGQNLVKLGFAPNLRSRVF